MSLGDVCRADNHARLWIALIKFTKNAGRKPLIHYVVGVQHLFVESSGKRFDQAGARIARA
jgi:succinyl-CoA synthetase alpha subunit